MKFRGNGIGIAIWPSDETKTWIVAEGAGPSVADEVEVNGLSTGLLRVKDRLIALCMVDQIKIATAKVMIIVSPKDFLGIDVSAWMICRLVCPNHSMS